MTACISYIRSMFKHAVKPNRVSWGMWSVAPLIATAAAISNGVGWAVLPVFMSGFSPLLIFLASFVVKKAYWKLSRFDYYCGALSILALALWALTNNPDIAILFAIASDALAAIPTIVKGWQSPKSENVAPFLAGLFSACTAFFAIIIWNFSSVAFPAYLAVINIILISAITIGKRR